MTLKRLGALLGALPLPLLAAGLVHLHKGMAPLPADRARLTHTQHPAALEAQASVHRVSVQHANRDRAVKADDANSVILA